MTCEAAVEDGIAHGAGGVDLETGPFRIRHSILQASHRPRFGICVLKFCMEPR